MLVCLLGKTASGKTAIRKKLIENGVKPNITYTSRPMREGETDHVDYHFLSDDEFQQKIDEGFFTEFKKYETKFGVWWYGSVLTNRDHCKDEVIILTPEGYRDVKDKLDEDVLSIYIYANNATIKERLKRRGDDKVEAVRRFEHDLIDFKGIENEVDRIVYNNLNDDLDDVTGKIIKIMKEFKK